ncbi:MAG: hypothetical protein JOS17DRAFT_797229 [Linnemannia elongata]|nr:MAG: hypothetical protein JOS17DRAFT_797229 [Linnemannia elongata]
MRHLTILVILAVAMDESIFFYTVTAALIVRFQHYEASVDYWLKANKQRLRSNMLA